MRRMSMRTRMSGSFANGVVWVTPRRFACCGDRSGRCFSSLLKHFGVSLRSQAVARERTIRHTASASSLAAVPRMLSRSLSAPSSARS